MKSRALLALFVFGGCAAGGSVGSRAAGPTQAGPGSASAPSASPALDPCAAGNAKACLDQAARPDVTSDPARAFALKKRACDLGDADGCFAVAIAIHDGKGTPADVPLGRKLFRDACQRGHAASCATLGALLGRGEEASSLRERACALGNQVACNDIGVDLVAENAKTKDPARANKLFERACDAGVAAACTNLAFLIEAPDDDQEAEGRRVVLYARACRGNNPAGCRELGVRHVDGLGMPRDEVAASHELETACAGDDAVGCDWLGWTYEHGLGRAVDAKSAVASYAKACDRTSANGCYNLGRAYADGRGVDKDEKHARQLYDTACAGGSTKACAGLFALHDEKDASLAEARLGALCNGAKVAACAALGRRLLWTKGTRERGLALLRTACDGADADACAQGLYGADEPPKGTKRQPELAFHFAESACKTKRGCGKLADLLLRGDGTKADPRRARAVAEAACAKEDGMGCFVLGEIEEQGKGGVRDAAKARDLFRKGCDASEARACDGLARVLRAGAGIPRDEKGAKEAEEKARDLRED